MKKCTNCGAQISDDCRFCTECGKPVPQGNVCPHCGASVNEGDAFCEKCGSKLQASDSSYNKDYEISDKVQNELPIAYSPSAYQSDNSSRTNIITFDSIKKPIIWTLCALLLIGGAIGGWYYYKKITAENEQAQWEKIKDTEELKDLENFLRQYPDGKYKVKAQERSLYVQKEISQWNNVAKTNNPEELKGFINKYKKGYYHNLAVEAYDELLWSLATHKNDLQSYRYYLEECPQGKYYQQAKEKADYQEKVSLDESEAEYVTQVVSRYFYAMARGDESGMLECLSSDLKSFMGKSNATKVDAIAYMHRLHADDVYSIDITMGEYEIKKTLDSQGEPQYTIDFSYDQRLNREDTSLETFASYKGTAMLNSQTKITSLSLTKTAKY